MALAKKIGLIVLGCFVALALIGALLDDGASTNTNDKTAVTTGNKTGEQNNETTGTLPELNESDYTDKEGLVVFKELTGKGYTVTAKYENERMPDANQDLTEQFKAADVNNCEDRLGFDAYVVSSVTQNGDNVTLSLDNNPTTNQTCPDGTPYNP